MKLFCRASSPNSRLRLASTGGIFAPFCIKGLMNGDTDRFYSASVRQSSRKYFSADLGFDTGGHQGLVVGDAHADQEHFRLQPGRQGIEYPLRFTFDRVAEMPLISPHEMLDRGKKATLYVSHSAHYR